MVASSRIRAAIPVLLIVIAALVLGVPSAQADSHQPVVLTGSADGGPGTEVEILWTYPEFWEDSDTAEMVWRIGFQENLWEWQWPDDVAPFYQEHWFGRPDRTPEWLGPDRGWTYQFSATLTLPPFPSLGSRIFVCNRELCGSADFLVTVSPFEVRAEPEPGSPGETVLVSWEYAGFWQDFDTDSMFWRIGFQDYLWYWEDFYPTMPYFDEHTFAEGDLSVTVGGDGQQLYQFGAPLAIPDDVNTADLRIYACNLEHCGWTEFTLHVSPFVVEVDPGEGESGERVRVSWEYPSFFADSENLEMMWRVGYRNSIRTRAGLDRELLSTEDHWFSTDDVTVLGDSGANRFGFSTDMQIPDRLPGPLQIVVCSALSCGWTDFTVIAPAGDSPYPVTVDPDTGIGGQVVQVSWQYTDFRIESDAGEMYWRIGLQPDLWSIQISDDGDDEDGACRQGTNPFVVECAFTRTEITESSGADGQIIYGFTSQLTLPASLSPGATPILVCDMRDLCGWATFTVLPPPTTTTTTTTTVPATTIPTESPGAGVPWIPIGAVLGAIAILGVILRMGRKPTPLDDPIEPTPPDVPIEPLPPATQPKQWIDVDVTADGEPRTRAFKSGATNTLSVSMEHFDTTRLQPDGRAARRRPDDGDVARAYARRSDDEQDPDDRELDVMVWAPGAMTEPRWGKIRLPDDGSPVGPFSLDLDLPVDIEEVTANITVLHKGRLVQAATLSGPVTAGGDPVGIEGLQIDLARTAPTELALDVARTFDATIITNKDDVNIRVGEATRHFVLGGVQQSVNTIQDALYRSAVGSITEDGLDTDEVRIALWTLAAHGHAIYRELVKGDTAALANAATIEVISRDPGDFLPVELVYDRGDPGDYPEICPQWHQAAEGECVGCPALGNGSRYVCPLGFWGMTKEIARRISVDLNDRDLISAHVSAPGPGRQRLAGFGPVLVGASHRVDGAGGPSQIEATVEFARHIGETIRVESWDEWANAIRNHNPSILVAMPHTDRNQVMMEVLQIGEASNLSPTRISERYVQQPPGEIGPVLLLLGCTTGAPEIGFLGFVPRFIEANAAVVVGTIAKVLGRHAGPVARLFLDEAVRSGGVRVGEAVRRLRRQALADGNVMGLTLALYGDADWMLGGTDD